MRHGSTVPGCSNKRKVRVRGHHARDPATRAGRGLAQMACTARNGVTLMRCRPRFLFPAERKPERLHTDPSAVPVGGQSSDAYAVNGDGWGTCFSHNKRHVDQSAQAMKDAEMEAEIEDFLEGFNQPTYRGMRINGVRVATWSSSHGWSGDGRPGSDWI